MQQIVTRNSLVRNTRYMNTFTINYDLGKYLKSLAILIGVIIENIWNYCAAVKQCE